MLLLKVASVRQGSPMLNYYCSFFWQTKRKLHRSFSCRNIPAGLTFYGKHCLSGRWSKAGGCSGGSAGVVGGLIVGQSPQREELGVTCGNPALGESRRSKFLVIYI